ncbi:MAG: DivIVA domain-containing protein [Propionibacteriaceae bacterium]|nr:DivIVA domain-containing protein [Propionibacteriaceae bacterium]
MALTLDQARNIHFTIVRQPYDPGYRASEVDSFLDQLIASYAEILDENQRLKSFINERPEASGGQSAQNGDRVQVGAPDV